MINSKDKTMNTELIKDEISQLGERATYEMISELLPKLITEKKLILDTSVYTPADPKTIEPNGIGRYLVYDHWDKTSPFSIWAFAFAGRQKTCIHDHKYKGTVIVLDGPISEKLYEPTSECTAKLIARSDRYRFHSNSDDLTGNFVHQLKRRKDFGSGTSVTLHIYNMEAQVINSGIQVDRRNLDIIYTKDKFSNKSKTPFYKEEFPEVSCKL